MTIKLQESVVTASHLRGMRDALRAVPQLTVEVDDDLVFRVAAPDGTVIFRAVEIWQSTDWAIQMAPGLLSPRS